MRRITRHHARGLATGLAFFVCSPALAQITLVHPIDCTLGDTCYIQQYTDIDPGPGHSDYTCGTLSYDGHKGTDFALPTIADQQAGVAVLAAAAGQVTAIRDDMIDHLQGTVGAPDITDRDCGNGLVIRHTDGWETQYCHMAQGSLTVRPGDIVDAGDTLGMVGLSGNTEFPHLHLSLRHRGMVVDPFAPSSLAQCGTTEPGLWLDPPEYVPGSLIGGGLTSSPPAFDAVKSGVPLARLGPNSPIIAWALLFGTLQDDRLSLRITGPQGLLHEASPTLTQQALAFQFSGRRAPNGGWPKGTYTVEITLLRDTQIIDSTILTALID